MLTDEQIKEIEDVLRKRARRTAEEVEADRQRLLGELWGKWGEPDGRATP